MPEEEHSESLIHIALGGEELFTVGGFVVTNSMVGAVLASLLLLGGAWYVARRSTLIPNRVQSLLELADRGIVAGIVEGRPAAGAATWRS